MAFDISVRRNGHTPVSNAARAAGKQAGILVRSMDDIPTLREQGFRYFAVDSDLGMKKTRELCS